MIRYLLILGLVAVVSCRQFTADKSKPKVMGLRSSFSENGKVVVVRWWESFGDDELNQLMTKAFEGNFSLAEAAARVEQMEAVSRMTAAGSKVSVDANAGLSQTRLRNGGARKMYTSTTGHNMGLSLRYELDVWGKLKARERAAELDVAASEEDLKAAVMALAGQIGDRWVSLKNVYLGQELVRRQIETAKKTLALMELRFRNSTATALDILQQKQNVEGLEAQLPVLVRQVTVLKNELAVLIGKSPGTEIKVSGGELPPLVDLPKTGLPADLLAARPDIRAVGIRLQGARWLEAAARADRLPSVTLTPSLMFSAARLDQIFENWVGKLAASLATPILDGGRRDAVIDRLTAVQKERLFAYRRVVMNAVREVENALVQETTQCAHIVALETQYQTANAGLEQAKRRYRKGQGDYLPVITQVASTQRLESELIRQRTELMKFRMGLYRALGGDWMDAVATNLKAKRGDEK